MPEVGVITSALRNEGKKWRDLSDKAAPIKSTVDGLTLSWTAFYVGDANAQAHASVYAGYLSFMSTLLGGAVTEFEQLGNALDKIADEYDKADAVVELDLNKVYSV
jgi:hypothetical protein